jgi:ATP-dependent Clp protease, protease subunit
MNLKTKQIILGIIAVVAIVAFPLVSAGKSESKDNITLNESNLVSLRGEVTDESVAAVIQQLRKLDEMHTDKPIYLFLYTPGGDIQAGLELIEAVHGLHRHVDTITMAAISMGFQIAQGLNERLALKSGLFMSHRAAGGFEGYFGGESPSQLDKRYSFWLQRIKELDEQTVARTKGKQTIETYRKNYSNEMWLSGQQAVEQGYADRVVTVRCDRSLDGTTDHTAQFLGMSFTYQLSKCPLITAAINAQPNQSSDEKTKLDPRIVEKVKNEFLNSFDIEKNIR